MKILIDEKDNENALDQAYQELEQLMEGRLAQGRIPKAPEPDPAALEMKADDEKPADDGPSEEELEHVLSQLKG